MTLTAILLVAALVFIAGTARAVRRRGDAYKRAQARAQLRTAIYAARVAADQARANRSND